MSDLSLALTLLGVSLSAALAYLPMTVRAPSILRSVFKTVPVALLAVIAWWQGGSWVLVAAFVASAMGDLALSLDGKIAFLTGMISFAVAHLAYLVVFLPFYGGVTVWAFVLVALAGVMAIAMWRNAGELRGPILGYIALICMMGIVAFGVVGVAWVPVAAAFFIVSDAMIAVHMFMWQPRVRGIEVLPPAIWATYMAAQLLFLVAFVAV